MNCIVCGKEIPKRRLNCGKTTCCRKCAFSTEEYRAKLSEAQKKRYNNTEARLATSLAIKKAYENPDVRQRLSLAHLKLGENQDYRQKLSNSVKAATNTDEYKLKRSKIAKELWQSKEYQQKISIIRKETWENPEYAKKKVASTKATLAKPEVRQKLSNIQKEAQNRLETKERRSKAQKLVWTSNDYRNKLYATKKKNGTFNTSKPEKDILDILQQKFNKVHYQYRSNLYPFNCDFYIEDLDLFIELNFHWTHGNGQYCNDEQWCIEQLNNWKEKAKTSKFYERAIYVWTDLDVRKRQCAIDNKLNWVVFYDTNQIDAWLKQFDIKETA